jgi:glucosyl-dolichyl phosphate glucuronosyltransferase
VGELPLLSIIITSYTMERLKDVFELLDSIKAQTYPHVETIFVAERSRELGYKVRTYAEEKGILNVKVVFNEGEPGLSSARNLGIKNTSGEIIGFVVDDAILAQDWAKELVSTFIHQDSAVGVTGQALPLWEDDSMSWFPTEFYWIIGCTAWYGQDKMTKTRNLWGMNMAFRKEVFQLCGLFSPSLGLWGGDKVGWNKPPGDENEFSLRVKRETGKNLFYNPRAIIKHKIRKKSYTFKLIAKEAYRIGLSRAILRHAYKGSQQSEDNLRIEGMLLRRIFTRLFPGILRSFFTHPIIAWRKLLVTITVLSFIAMGYYFYFFVFFRNRRIL